MIRVWPRSIAGRTTLILIAGMLLVLCLAAIVWWMGLFAFSGDSRGPWLIERVATVAKMVDHLPPENRHKAVGAWAGDDFQVEWTEHRPSLDATHRSWRPRWGARHLRELFKSSSIVIDYMGFAGNRRNGSRDTGIILLRLSDQSWLKFTARRLQIRQSRFTAAILSILVFAGGITLLAVWVSRRVTSPLGRFAAAAGRIGTDVSAPPMAVSGPSEIRTAAQSFNRMQERIRRFVEDRTLMLAAISHDLRTVLTRLRLRVEYIADEEQRSKALADMDDMQTMLESTLSFAREDAAEEETTLVDVSGLVQTICDEKADTGAAVSFAGYQRLVVACRPVAVRRALENLIDNAILYGNEAVVSLAETEEGVAIEIADRGPGIPITEHEAVFAPFYRLEGSRSRETGGTGLGLSVARTIARRHGGDITLHDRPGGGLVVRFVLPQTEGAIP
jgi:signal transduction histidine kinase